MKILIITHVNPFTQGSGQVQRVFNTIKALAIENYNLEIITINEHKTKLNRLKEIQNYCPYLKVFYLKSGIFNLIFKPLFIFLSYLGFGKLSNLELPFIFRKLKRYDVSSYDLILFEYWHLFKLASYYRKMGKFVICDTHNILTGSYEIFVKKFPLSWYRKYLTERYRHLEFNVALKSGFDLLIAINKEEHDYLKNIFPDKEIIYCPMGIQLPVLNLKKSVTSKVNKTIVYYGGLGNPKNASDALLVYNEIFLINKSLKWDYLIVGSNPPESLQKIAFIDSRVRLTGFVDCPNLEKIFLECDLAVIPFEGKFGFRSRIIELMYYGVPILTTEDSIWGMGFVNKENIFIFSSFNNLFKQVNDLINDSHLLKYISENARKRVDSEFTFEKTYINLAKRLNEYAMVKNNLTNN